MLYKVRKTAGSFLVRGMLARQAVDAGTTSDATAEHRKSTEIVECHYSQLDLRTPLACSCPRPPGGRRHVISPHPSTAAGGPSPAPQCGKCREVRLTFRNSALAQSHSFPISHRQQCRLRFLAYIPRSQRLRS